jgi:multidrug efflux system outer membrane protein
MMKYALILSTAFTLTACETFREYVMPGNPSGVENMDMTSVDSKFYQAQKPVSAWWDEFNDITLSDLVDQSLKTNLDVRIALANLAEARALRSAVGYDRFPTVTSDASYARTMASRETSGTAQLGDRYRDSYEAGFDASWELDLFGRVSNRIKAQQALEEASVADLQAVYVTVTAEVARNYMELRGSQYQLDIAKRNARNQRETYNITRKLVEGGRGNKLDTSRARTQLDLTLATIPPLETRTSAAINRLSVLTGQIPDALRADLTTKQALPTLPVSVAIGDASALLKRRPDIYAAERTLAAATANYNIAVAELFPSVNLVGSIGYVATNLSSFGASALAGSIGPSLSWRAFDLARARSEIKASDARSMAALASYEKIVLEALEETQTALTEFRNEEERRRILQSAARAAKNAAYIARQRYNEGVDDFLTVLDSERVLLDAESSLAVSETTSATDLVAVYKALGGGWMAVADIEETDVE